MLNYIRSLPDFDMVFVMYLFGTATWFALLFICFGIPYLWRRFKRTITYKCIQIQRDNAKLRKYISELRRENIHDSIR